MLPLSAGKKVALIGPFASQLKGKIGPLNQGGEVVVENGCAVAGSDSSGIPAAVAAAQAADHVILYLGSTSKQEAEYHDRSNTILPGVQNELAQRVLAVGKAETVVVLNNRGALAIDDLAVSAPAIL